MSFDKSKYPPYWRQFSLYIRKERAGDRCEKCGAKNGWIKFSHKGFMNGACFVDPEKTEDIEGLRSYLAYFGKRLRETKIVLTVAHLDHRGGVCECRKIYGFKCARPDHVRALCQSCHLNLDRPKHVAVRAKNLARKKDEQRGLLQLI